MRYFRMCVLFCQEGNLGELEISNWDLGNDVFDKTSLPR